MKSRRSLYEFIVTIAILYLMISFYEWDINPLEWGWVSIRFAGLGCICYALMEYPKLKSWINKRRRHG